MFKILSKYRLTKYQATFAFLFWMLILYFSYLMLKEEMPRHDGWEYGDKVAHALAFLALSIAGSLAFKKLTLLMYGLAFYGALIEVLQANITVTRSGDPYDWLADLAGILVCIIVIKLIQQCKSKPSSSIPSKPT